jgi:outer membrane lipoprotein SlyB
MIQLIVASLFAFLLVGCTGTSNFSSNKYDTRSAGEISRTDLGTIISMREVELQPESSGAGAALGAAGGAVAGGLIGRALGSRKSLWIPAMAGAAVGGVVGNKISTAPEKGIEYTVKKEDGQIIVIAQAPDSSLHVGQKVRLIYSQRGNSRIVAA